MSIPATAGHAYEKPLILTPLIKAGKLDEAKQLAQVKELPNAPQVDSFSGFLTVNEQYESNLFFWFFRNVSLLPPSHLLIDLSTQWPN